jgi:hypothetical protein
VEITETHVLYHQIISELTNLKLLGKKITEDMDRLKKDEESLLQNPDSLK